MAWDESNYPNWVKFQCEEVGCVWCMLNVPQQKEQSGVSNRWERLLQASATAWLQDPTCGWNSAEHAGREISPPPPIPMSSFQCPLFSPPSKGATLAQTKSQRCVIPIDNTFGRVVWDPSMLYTVKAMLRQWDPVYSQWEQHGATLHGLTWQFSVSCWKICRLKHPCWTPPCTYN